MTTAQIISVLILLRTSASQTTHPQLYAHTHARKQQYCTTYSGLFAHPPPLGPRCSLSGRLSIRLFNVTTVDRFIKYAIRYLWPPSVSVVQSRSRQAGPLYTNRNAGGTMTGICILLCQRTTRSSSSTNGGFSRNVSPSFDEIEI